MPRQERERRFISEYMKETWPEGNYQINVELGPIPEEYVQRYGIARAAALFRPTRPRVDAVKWDPDRYYIIEAKIRDIKAGIGDLLYYMNVLAATPDLPNYTGQPIIARLVIPWSLEWLKPIADVNNIEIVVYERDWIAEYVKERQHYFSAEYRAARAEKMRIRTVLGVD